MESKGTGTLARPHLHDVVVSRDVEVSIAERLAYANASLDVLLVTHVHDSSINDKQTVLKPVKVKHQRKPSRSARPGRCTDSWKGRSSTRF
jgi:hypothetical protein